MCRHTRTCGLWSSVRAQQAAQAGCQADCTVTKRGVPAATAHDVLL